jgi:uncharacterized protein (TIGR02271 family)
VPESEAGYYSEAVRRGSTLVTVQASEPEAERVASILDRSGARDIEGMAAEWHREGWAGPTAEAEAETAREGWAGRATGTEARPEGWTGAPVGAASAREAWTGAAAGADAPREGWAGVEAGAGARAADEERRAIPVVREELQVGKRAVQHGGVRVYSRVTEEPAEEQVRLREERVQVERRPADRAVRPEDTAAFQETAFEMRETAEEPVVAKQARVIEEVVIGKDVQERTETVRDRVRRTSVDVERTGDAERAGRAAGGGTPRYEAWESDFRQHCDTAFAGSGWSYEDCAPAYRYGHTLASDPGFAGRDWPAIEADARQRWEEHNPGTWDRFEDSIRYAWDRVRGQARAA